MKKQEAQADLFKEIQLSSAPNVEINSQVLKPRLVRASRDQIKINIASINELIPSSHRARLIWDFVNKLDLSLYLKNIKSVECHVGRPATDPKILVALWLYATVEGIASAGRLSRYCTEHHGFIWVRGDVNVSRKSLSDFRAEQGELLNDLLAQSVATLLKNDLINLEEMAQDGMRVRASAGSSSFKRLKTLNERLKAAKDYLKELQKNKSHEELSEQKRKTRLAKQAKEKLEESINEMEELKKTKNELKAKQRKKPLTKKEVTNLRVSTTDKEARIMKMGDGGFRPAYNVQFATSVKGQAIVGVSLTNSGSDAGLMKPMFEAVKEKYKVTPKNWLADCGFMHKEDIEFLDKEGCEVILPPKKTKKSDPYKPKKNDSEAIAKWRKRMGTEEAKEKYKLRSQTAEFPNAEARNRTLSRFLVRDMDKALNVSLMFAIAYNFFRINNLFL